MTIEYAVVIGLGFFITIVTTVVLARANRYWKGRDPFEGEPPIAKSEALTNGKGV